MIDVILPWLPLITIAVGGIIAGGFTILNRRGGEHAARRRQLPPTWPEMWARIDTLEKRIQEADERATQAEERAAERDSAMVRVLAAIAAQWPHGHPRPVLDLADVEILADTIPAPWRPPRPTKRRK